MDFFVIFSCSCFLFSLDFFFLPALRYFGRVSVCVWIYLREFSCQFIRCCGFSMAQILIPAITFKITTRKHHKSHANDICIHSVRCYAVIRSRLNILVYLAVCHCSGTLSQLHFRRTTTLVKLIVTQWFLPWIEHTCPIANEAPFNIHGRSNLIKNWCIYYMGRDSLWCMSHWNYIVMLQSNIGRLLN